MEKKDLNVVFKDYNPNQLMLLPTSLEELISVNHPGRTIHQIIERIDLSSVYNRFSENRASSYHPKMLLKVLVYGYLENCYSSQKLEKAIGENIVCNNVRNQNMLKIEFHGLLTSFARVKTLFKPKSYF